MWFRCLLILVACAAGGATVAGYVRFLKKRCEEYGRVLDFLSYAEERMRAELTSVTSSARSFFGEGAERGALAAYRYLSPEDREAFEGLLLSSAKPTLEAELSRIGEVGDKILVRFREYKSRIDKNIKIAVTLFSGAALGSILLLL